MRHFDILDVLDVLDIFEYTLCDGPHIPDSTRQAIATSSTKMIKRFEIHNRSIKCSYNGRVRKKRKKGKKRKEERTTCGEGPWLDVVMAIIYLEAEKNDRS